MLRPIKIGDLTLNHIWGTRGNDTLYCEANSVVLGMAGNDSLYTKPLGQNVNQVLMGGLGDDAYYTGPNSKSFILDVEGIDGNNTLHNAINLRNVQFNTVNGNHLVMSDPTNNWEVIIPKVFVSNLKTVSFASGESFSFNDFIKIIQNGPQTSSIGNPSATAFVDVCGELGSVRQTPGYTGQYSDRDQGAVQFFDTNTYLANKAAVAQTDIATLSKAIADAGMRVIDHFRFFGAFEADGHGKIGINPSSMFDVNNYYEQKVQLDHKNGGNSTVEGMAKAFQAGGLDPMTHYMMFGRTEGLKPQPVVTTVGLDADLHDIVGEGA